MTRSGVATCNNDGPFNSVRVRLVGSPAVPNPRRRFVKQTTAVRRYGLALARGDTGCRGRAGERDGARGHESGPWAMSRYVWEATPTNLADSHSV